MQIILMSLRVRQDFNCTILMLIISCITEEIFIELIQSAYILLTAAEFLGLDFG